MSTLHARVKGGQIVVEGKTDLPEGTELTLVMVEEAMVWPRFQPSIALLALTPARSSLGSP